jgi:hypothetical protein
MPNLKGKNMTAKCANPSCNQLFLYFRAGRIFLIESSSSGTPAIARRTPEYFWLCGDCSRTMRVVLDRNGDVAIEGREPEKPTIAFPALESRLARKRASAQAGD